MKDSKLIEILKTFTPDEFKELEKFTASPYFTVGRDLTPFLKVLKTFYPSFNHENLNYEHIYSRLYPGKSTSNVQQTMKTLSSDFIRLCKEFLKQSEFKKDTGRGNYYLLNQLRQRKLYKDFEKENKSSLLYQSESNNGGISDFIQKYYLDSVFRDASLDRDDFVNSFEFTIAADENIVAAALMAAFMHEDLKNTSMGYNLPIRHNIMKILLKNLDADKLLEEMKMNNDRFYPYVQIYYWIYKMNKHREDPEHYYKLKKLLIENQKLFGQSENYVFWNILMSYCNVNPMEDEILNIEKYILENNIYKKSGAEDFHVILFRNIVYNAISYEANSYGWYEWLENFIEKYSPELHSEHRENMYNFSFAFLYFYKGEYEKALMYIGKVNQDIFIFKMDARILLMEIYFELSLIEQAYSLIDSFMHFIRNTNEFTEKNKELYRNFIKIYKEILKIKESNDKSSLHIIRKKILDDNVVQKQWLMSKIDNM